MRDVLVCVARGCVWQGRVHGGGMHDGGHVWGGACMVGGVHGGGGVVLGGGMRGRGGGHVWWGHAWHAYPPPAPDTTRYGRSMSGRYTSYWKAFLSFNLGKIKFNLSLNASLAFSTGNLEGLGRN